MTCYWSALDELHTLFFIFKDAVCDVPEIYWGDWYTMEGGIERNIVLNRQQLTHETYTGGCNQMKKINGTEDAEGNYNSLVLFNS